MFTTKAKELSLRHKGNFNSGFSIQPLNAHRHVVRDKREILFILPFFISLFSSLEELTTKEGRTGSDIKAH